MSSHFWERRAWKIALGIMMLLAIAAQSSWTQSGAMLPRRLALHALACLCLVHAAPRMRAGMVSAVACALALWQVLAWAVSDVRWVGLPRLLDGIAGLMLFVAVSAGYFSRRSIVLLMVRAGTVGAGIGLLEQWVQLPGLIQATRPSAFFVSRAVAGEFVVASLLLTVGFLPAKHRKLAAVAVFLQVAFLISARSRTAWGIALPGLLWVGYRLSVRERRTMGCAVVLAALFAAFLTPGPRLRWTSSQPYVDSWGSLVRADVGGRMDTWRNTLVLVAEHPWLGVGPGGFSATYPAYHRAVVRDRAFSSGQQIEEPHNEPLRWAVELGVPGAVGYLLLMGWSGTRALRRANRRTTALSAALLGLMVASLVSMTFVAVPTWMLAATVAGLLGRGGTGARWHPPPLLTRVAAAGLALAFLATDVPQWQASRAWLQAEYSLRQGRPRAAYESLREAADGTHALAAYIRLAEVAKKSGDVRGCVEAAREGSRRSPSSTRLQELAGDCELLAGNVEAARAAYLEALRLLPDDPFALWGLARLSTGTERASMLLQAAEAVRLEQTLLPAVAGRAELERLQEIEGWISVALAEPGVP